jgi:hypothetical protein
MNLLKLLQANLDVHGVTVNTRKFDLRLLHKRNFFHIFKAIIYVKNISVLVLTAQKIF